MDGIHNGNAPRLSYVGEVAESGRGYYLLGGRPYCPTTRSFASPDALSPFDDGGLNRYAYCGSDPINRVDPSGESFWDWLGITLGIGIAVAATVASGGALAAAVGAAGGLGAALSTSSGAIAASAAALDVMSVGVEIGSAVAVMRGDEQAGGIFGWIAVGVGLASIGTSVASVVKGTGKVAASAADDRFDRVLFSGRGTGTQGVGSVTKIEDPRQLQNPKRFKIQGGGALGEDDVKTNVFAIWRRYEIGAAVHYAPDMRVNMRETKRMFPRIMERNTSAQKIVLHVGVHGQWHGQNYLVTGAHRPAEARILKIQVASFKRQFGDNYAGKKIVFNNISGMSRTDVESAFRTPGVHIHVKCFGAADEVLRELAAAGPATVYVGPRRYYLKEGNVVPLVR